MKEFKREWVRALTKVTEYNMSLYSQGRITPTQLQEEIEMAEDECSVTGPGAEEGNPEGWSEGKIKALDKAYPELNK